MSKEDLYYLRSCLTNLRELLDLVHTSMPGPTIGTEVLADNINWLEHFIEKHGGNR
jgi:hypothetical protein